MKRQLYAALRRPSRRSTRFAAALESVNARQHWRQTSWCLTTRHVLPTRARAGRRWHQRHMGRARRIGVTIGGSFFARRPDRAVSVEIVRSTSRFLDRCDWRFSAGCEHLLGAYSRRSREILANVGPGLPTLAHELIHPLVQTDFPRIPVWFDEGLAALFEQPVFQPAGEMHGVDNWRYEGLTRAARYEPAKVHLPLLFALTDVAGPDRDLHYAEARALCQWLDERGQLWPFYRAWRDRVSEDPKGEKSFAQVTGTTPAEADSAWVAWVKERRSKP